ncbi:S8 family serine peptidase [Catenovulum sp. SM1970]|uniref:S8 family serine peptidase n=1 Tax=Marinifaba aquimaris TaxID=2741323 RepID=UPI001573A62C|nr:S8 family serine peptidase [Marinifaba aquimaris]NTS77753.1 S8 family serine peptidase [Marinifaba aquimaris]
MSTITKSKIAKLNILALAIAGITNSAWAQEETTRYIVKMKDSNVSQFQLQQDGMNLLEAKSFMLQQTADAANLEVARALPQVNAMAVELTPAQHAELSQNENVEYIEVDPKRYLYAESTPYGINMVQALQVPDAGSANRKVCIVDSGYKLDHPDLYSSGVTGYAMAGAGNWYEDGNSHGTHVAGTIAAIGGNGQGVVGVNRSGNLGLHIVKVFNDQGTWAYGSDLADAVNRCVQAGSNVISMSLGGGGSSTTERNAFQNAHNAGVLSIAAAGNDGNSSISYPASYDIVMSVAAVDSSENKASFSQYNQYVEIAAPGVGVNSTWNNNGYKSISGTSMATPHVSGVAALVWGNFPECSNQQIRDALNSTAKDKGTPGRDNSYGYGIVQAKAAYDYLENSSCGTTGNIAPVAKFSYQVNGKSVSFSDSSTDDKGVASHAWSFGDGASSSSANPSHTYSQDGTYTVSLTVKDAEGLANTSSQQVVISTDVIEPPKGCDGLEPWSVSTSYGFGDLVSYKNYKFEAIWWSTGAQPDVFSNVWKRVSECTGGDNGGGDTNQAPVSDFSYTASDLTVSFNQNASDDKGVVAYSWNFGDGASSISANPSHTYAADGSYNVTLVVEDAEGLTSSKSMQVTVSAGNTGGGDCGAVAAWSASSTYLKGDQAQQNGKVYEANWWTRNQSPAENSGRWSVWTEVKTCQ